MKAQRVQGLVFSLSAVFLTAASLVLGRLDERIELVVVASLIVVLGVPHGALDTLFAHRLYGIRTIGGLLGFGAIYLFLSGLVVGLWLLQPALFLAGFLIISAVHFSGDPPPGTPWPARALYGGAILVFPALLHSEDVDSSRFSLERSLPRSSCHGLACSPGLGLPASSLPFWHACGRIG